jgi:hypothetical protein
MNVILDIPEDLQEHIKAQIQESLDSDSEAVNPEYWQELRASIFGGEYH